MVDYKKLYHIMVDASEKALSEMEKQNYESAWVTLIKGEQAAEKEYLEMTEDSPAEKESGI